MTAKQSLSIKVLAFKSLTGHSYVMGSPLNQSPTNRNEITMTDLDDLSPRGGLILPFLSILLSAKYLIKNLSSVSRKRCVEVAIG